MQKSSGETKYSQSLEIESEVDLADVGGVINHYMLNALL
jgi:hypothetical protein